MSALKRLAPLPNRQRLEFGWAIAVATALAATLIWVFWVLPISRSVGSATPAPIGGSVVYHVEKGKTAGIWTSGQASLLSTVSCTVEEPDGE